MLFQLSQKRKDVAYALSDEMKIIVLGWPWRLVLKQELH